MFVAYRFESSDKRVVCFDGLLYGRWRRAREAYANQKSFTYVIHAFGVFKRLCGLLIVLIYAKDFSYSHFRCYDSSYVSLLFSHVTGHIESTRESIS